MSDENKDNKPEKKADLEDRIVSLDTFLDVVKTNRSERTRYEKLHKEPYQELSIKEWRKVTGLTEK